MLCMPDSWLKVEERLTALLLVFIFMCWKFWIVCIINLHTELAHTLTPPDMPPGVFSQSPGPEHTYPTRHATRGLFTVPRSRTHLPHQTCHQGSFHSPQVQNTLTPPDMPPGVFSQSPGPEHTYPTRHATRGLFTVPRSRTHLPHQTCHQGSFHSPQVQNTLTPPDMPPGVFSQSPGPEHTYPTRHATRGLFTVPRSRTHLPHQTCHQGSFHSPQVQNTLTPPDMPPGVFSQSPGPEHTYPTRHATRGLFTVPRSRTHLPHQTCHQGSFHSPQVQNTLTPPDMPPGVFSQSPGPEHTYPTRHATRGLFTVPRSRTNSMKCTCYSEPYLHGTPFHLIQRK
ncbi:mucin-2-like [Oncorhynchus keta]|uniref:mucin-2-like n=1 Tax=Oncorhynchus keta TaxID=8018 RepID=UPI00227AE8AA|nr:mucin-2-like [Oncorhynchus keta]